MATLTVASVLSLGALGGAELLAGRRGLDRRVAGVNIIEVPDVARWLRGQEFLLTSAYLWRDRPDELCQLLVKLDDLGVSALGHKPSQHLARLSDDVIATADELGFPIVQLPEDLPYREVFEVIYMLRFGHHRSSFRPDLATQLGLEPDDHSMAEAVTRLAREFRVRVEVVDQLEGLVHGCDAQGPVQSDPLRVPSEDAATSLGLREDHEPHQVTAGNGIFWVAPLVVDGQVRGRLTVSGDNDAVDLPTVMEMTDLLSLLQIRRRSYRRGLQGAQDLTFRALVRGTLAPDELVERARDLRLVDVGRWWLGVVRFDGPTVSEGTVAELRRVLDRRVSSSITVLGAEPGEPSLVLLARGDESSQEDAVALLRELVTPPTRLQVGWSSWADHARKVPVALREARIALSVCRVSEGRDVVAFDGLGAEAVLAQVPPGDVVDAFVADRVGKLADPALVRTLELYVSHQGNKTATANAIPMHRSGLLYRLNKISELLGVDLDDPEVLNEMWLAFKLRWLQGHDG